MVYEPSYYTIKEKDINGKNLIVSMKIKSHELHEVGITANAPHIAFDNPVDWFFQQNRHDLFSILLAS